MLLNNAKFYLQGQSSVHQFDARSKILLLFIFSISIFFINSYIGLLIDLCLLLICIKASKIPFQKISSGISVIYIICTLIVICNCFTFGEALIPNSDLSLFYPFAYIDSLIEHLNYPIVGSLIFSTLGLFRGLFFAFRIIFLTWATLLICYTTTTNEMTYAFSSFLHPLKRFGVPVDDISMVCSIALRFIPLTFDEYLSIKEAQWSRGADFDSGSYIARIKAHGAIFIPLLVNLFKKANKLALTLDSRCYGYRERTNIHASKISQTNIAYSILISALIIAVAIVL